MKNYLNKPESIELGLLSAGERIKRIEEAVGYDKISELSVFLAEFLFHMQLEEPSLTSIVQSKVGQSHIATSILSASCEIQTAYHVLTTGNIPAVYRQCRLIHEFTAVAIFISIPQTLLLSSLSSKSRLAQKLKENPEIDFWNLYSPTFKKTGRTHQRTAPIIKGNFLLDPYLDFLRKCLPLNPKDVNWLAEQIIHVMHPTSHGSVEMLPYHFASLKEDGKGGINYSPGKIQLYRDAMDYLLWTVHFLCQVLDMTRGFVVENK